jgi:hypothetical protein
MDSPTKRFKRATGKILRKEWKATLSSHTLSFALLQAIVAILLGLFFSYAFVALFR